MNKIKTYFFTSLNFRMGYHAVAFLIFLLMGDLSACVKPHKTPVVKYLKKNGHCPKNSGMPLVDCIYVINLDRRPEKWQRIEALLEQRGLSACRFSAVDGATLTDEDQIRLAGDYPVRMLRGEVGCLLSHVSVLKDALDKGYKLIWVMEDDIEFVEDPRQLPELIKTLKKIDADWDVLYTDIDSKNSEGITVPAVDVDFRPDRLSNFPAEYYQQRTAVSSDLMHIGQRYGMYSLLISRKGMKKIYKYFSHVYLWSAIDIDIHYIPTIRQYSTTRDIVSIWYQSPFSDTKQLMAY